MLTCGACALAPPHAHQARCTTSSPSADGRRCRRSFIVRYSKSDSSGGANLLTIWRTIPRAGDYAVGDVISLLWFKRSLPKYATRFIDMCVMLCADHGPCVSGAAAAREPALAAQTTGLLKHSSLLALLLRAGVVHP